MKFSTYIFTKNKYFTIFTNLICLFFYIMIFISGQDYFYSIGLFYLTIAFVTCILGGCWALNYQNYITYKDTTTNKD